MGWRNSPTPPKGEFKMNKDIKNLIEKIEKLGWNVDFEQRKDEYCLDLEIWDTTGGDFTVSVSASDSNGLKRSLEEYLDNYDIDEEIEINLEPAKEFGLTIRQLVGAIEERRDMLKTLVENI